jgi:formamidopyrimidine-DNA glycosylase
VPELPEVETLARDLAPRLAGRTVAAVQLRRPSVLRYPDPETFIARLLGRRIQEVGRRGKYLLHHLEGGDLLVVHLGMSGQWRCALPSEPEPTHLHLLLNLDDGGQLRYRDPRRFGRVLLGTEAELVAAGRLPRLGPEPLDPAFTPARLRQRLAGRRAPLKAALLDQRVVAGIGNIYADEACFLARLRPDRAAGSLGRVAAARLHAGLRQVLEVAIQSRGTSIADYRDAWGEIGHGQERLLVYGRAGEPCPRCGRPLGSSRLAGRTTVFCRSCQR